MKTFKEFNNINESKINEDSNGLQGVKEYRDGLTLEMIQEQFPWILLAKIKNAVLGIDKKGLVWYNGTWKNGNWFDGTWKNGTWDKGVWGEGVWENGTWENGTGEDGRWEKGTWEDGDWKNGEWNRG